MTEEANTLDALARCPFCGGETRDMKTLRQRLESLLPDRDAKFAPRHFYLPAAWLHEILAALAKAEAIAAWNRRAPAALDALAREEIARVEKLIRWIVAFPFLAEMPADGGQAYDGISEALTESGIAPQVLVSDLRAILSRLSSVVEERDRLRDEVEWLNRYTVAASDLHPGLSAEVDAYLRRQALGSPDHD